MRASSSGLTCGCSPGSLRNQRNQTAAGNSVSQISVQVASKDQMQAATQEITDILRARHHIRLNDDFTIQSQDALLSSANQERPDAQHRVTIPPILREYAGLERDLTVIGAGNRAEIWSTSAWNAYYAAVEDDYVNTAEEVIPGLF